MSTRGRSLSMFVVQRTFALVRRGYDTQEVDRHLELVASWFQSTDIGAALSHERAQLDQRERAVQRAEAELERSVRGAQLEAEATLEGARRRAQADTGAGERALAERRAQAERERAEILDAARAEAEASTVVRAAREEADRVVRAAREEAERIVVAAREEANAVVAAAREEAERAVTVAGEEAERIVGATGQEAERELAGARLVVEQLLTRLVRRRWRRPRACRPRRRRTRAPTPSAAAARPTASSRPRGASAAAGPRGCLRTWPREVLRQALADPRRDRPPNPCSSPPPVALDLAPALELPALGAAQLRASPDVRPTHQREDAQVQDGTVGSRRLVPDVDVVAAHERELGHLDVQPLGEVDLRAAHDRVHRQLDPLGRELDLVEVEVAAAHDVQRGAPIAQPPAALAIAAAHDRHQPVRATRPRLHGEAAGLGRPDRRAAGGLEVGRQRLELAAGARRVGRVQALVELVDRELPVARRAAQPVSGPLAIRVGGTQLRKGRLAHRHGA